MKLKKHFHDVALLPSRGKECRARGEEKYL